MNRFPFQSTPKGNPTTQRRAAIGRARPRRCTNLAVAALAALTMASVGVASASNSAHADRGGHHYEHIDTSAHPDNPFRCGGC